MGITRKNIIFRRGPPTRLKCVSHKRIRPPHSHQYLVPPPRQARLHQSPASRHEGTTSASRQRPHRPRAIRPLELGGPARPCEVGAGGPVPSGAEGGRAYTSPFVSSTSHLDSSRLAGEEDESPLCPPCHRRCPRSDPSQFRIAETRATPSAPHGGSPRQNPPPRCYQHGRLCHRCPHSQEGGGMPTDCTPPRTGSSRWTDRRSRNLPARSPPRGRRTSCKRFAPRTARTPTGGPVTSVPRRSRRSCPCRAGGTAAEGRPSSPLLLPRLAFRVCCYCSSSSSSCVYFFRRPRRPPPAPGLSFLPLEPVRRPSCRRPRTIATRSRATRGSRPCPVRFPGG
mmetsp:Transcript_25377/g.74699  ORF Transcript_25377/g.74699 Transcript_25377/m.74699 type:complete len:339 (+) Transcript_25377:326-1342(+)